MKATGAVMLLSWHVVKGIAFPLRWEQDPEYKPPASCSPGPLNLKNNLQALHWISFTFLLIEFETMFRDVFLLSAFSLLSAIGLAQLNKKLSFSQKMSYGSTRK